jgi:hypothetical protein
MLASLCARDGCEPDAVAVSAATVTRPGGAATHAGINLDRPSCL